MTGVVGVIFFIWNAAFSTVLLILVLVASGIAIFAKNPDTRYQPMRDDRGSFIKSQTQLTTELDALGATARGESKHGFTNNRGNRFEDDDDEWSGSSGQHQPQQQQTAYGGAGGANQYGSEPGSGQHVPQTYQRNGAASQYSSNDRTGSMTSQNRTRQQGAGPSPWQRGAGYE